MGLKAFTDMIFKKHSPGQGLMRRWLIRVASIVFAVLTIVAISVFLVIRSYYYSTARMVLNSYATSQAVESLGLYGNTAAGFRRAAVDYVENFTGKATATVWVLDRQGSVLVSSSGFDIPDKVTMPDFDKAMQDGSASWTGQLPGGEKIMAVCTKATDGTSEALGAVRYMVSLDAIDKQLVMFGVLIASIAAVTIALVFFSSIAFIRSIVNPVKRIGKAAKLIATGDLTSRIENYPYNDEIGELCLAINDMAEKLGESDKMKNDFISTVSHELKTPLTAITGWGETLSDMEEASSPLVKKGLDIIVNESKRLNGMVEELLDFSRINSKRLKLNRENINLVPITDETVLSYVERAKKKNVAIGYKRFAKLVPVCADPSRLKQVLINVIDNAIKYTDSGGKISICIGIDGQSAYVKVEDTGAGIAENDLPHIKEKFYKANHTVRGSGIGLAVCDEIMKLHSGRLDIDSLLNVGTQVIISLPLDEAQITDGEK